MGRYYPPDEDNPPQFNKNSHPLGQRAKKINQGVLTVRFELPFAVWCQHCKPEAIVGQGVRFNAEKKRVGSYHSTPIWAFRMKHTACGGTWEIRTDPKNTEYIVVEGARKRDYGPEEKEAREEMAFLTEAEREKRRNDAFAGLEGRMEEQGLQKKHTERVGELYDAAMVWEDPYTANAKLRKVFRTQRKVLEKEQEHKERIQDKFSLGMDIADEIESDKIKAQMVGFGIDGGREDEAARKPLFANESCNTTGDGVAPKVPKLKRELKVEKTKTELQKSLIGNTRAVINPFSLEAGDVWKTSTKLHTPHLKRKREEDLPASGPKSRALANDSDLSTGAAKESGDSHGPPVSVPLMTSGEPQSILAGYDSD